ncbi:MAG: D-alanyl-D-alanine carboxypeptidase [Peptococcaceae bacterium]|nr:D-alanyl-D-alanine carboxypeptidase [Peptococcaceae bacterium]
MDAETGQVLYAKNPHQPRPIASTTKIMTALLAIECGDLKGEVTVSPRAAGVDGSSIYLRAGEKLSLEELLYGALLHSGNDACVAIAEHVAGREEIFIDWMNYKALKMGLKNTHFSNTNGLPHKEHYSSAYDLAAIAMYALKNPVFNRIVATKNHFINGPGGRRHLSNTNQMLWGYKGADGVKTGTTNAAGKCLVASASREGRRLIAVVLHSDNRYADSIRLLDYGFSNFENRTMAKKGEAVTWVSVRDGVKESVSAGCPRDIVVTVPVNGTAAIEKAILPDRGLRAPVKPGMAAGRLLVLIDGNPVAETELITMEQVNRLPVYGLLFNKIRNGIKQNLSKTPSSNMAVDAGPVYDQGFLKASCTTLRTNSASLMAISASSMPYSSVGIKSSAP